MPDHPPDAFPQGVRCRHFVKFVTHLWNSVAFLPSTGSIRQRIVVGVQGTIERSPRAMTAPEPATPALLAPTPGGPAPCVSPK